MCRSGWFSAPELWRFEPRQSDEMCDCGGRHAVNTVAGEIVGINECSSRVVSSAFAVAPAVTGATLCARAPRRCRMKSTADATSDVAVAASSTGGLACGG